MKARFRITAPVPDINDNICGQAVVDATTTALELLIKVADETIIDTVDLSVYNLAGNPVNITLTNGIVVNLTLENLYYYTLDIAYPMPLNPRIWDSTTLRIRTSLGTDASTYDQTFEIYDYDLGNDPNVTNSEGDAVNYNPTLDIVLNTNLASAEKEFSSFTAYRKPFTDLIQIYNLFSTPGNCIFYNDEDDTVLLAGAFGYLCKGEDITIRQELVNDDETCSSTLIVPEKQWFPDWSVAISCASCDEDCVNTASDNTALTTIDFSSLSKIFRNDTYIYPYQDQQIIYNLFNYAGDLVDAYVYNFKLGTPTSTFVPLDGAWVGFNTPNVGDYIVRTSLAVVGLESEIDIDSTGDLLQGRWYRIIDPGAGADFTTVGADDNNLGTDFPYIGGTITWGTGIVNYLTNVMECFKTSKITSCAWFDLVKTACGAFTIYNRSFNPIYIKVSAMDTDGNFTALTDYSSYLLTGLSSLSLDLSTDNIYKVERIPDPNNPNVKVQNVVYIIYSYCTVQSCGLEFINKILCNKETDSCVDYFKDVYDYIAFVTTLFTYFNILNSEYNFNYFYDGLSPNKLIELQSAKSVLDKLLEYCNASTTCDTCGSTAKCNCINK